MFRTGSAKLGATAYSCAADRDRNAFETSARDRREELALYDESAAKALTPEWRAWRSIRNYCLFKGYEYLKITQQ